MVGRGVYGRPWIAAQIEAELSGRPFAAPGGAERLEIVLAHFRDSLSFYGTKLGLKIFRKHLAAYVEAGAEPADAGDRRTIRAALCRLDDPAAIEAGLTALWLGEPERLAA
jgi:tRNA-dihydrouridine synthase